jgi:hypothetical protein
MIAWTVECRGQQTKTTARTRLFLVMKSGLPLVTAPYYIPDEALMITRSQAHDFNWQNARHEAVVTAAGNFRGCARRSSGDVSIQYDLRFTTTTITTICYAFREMRCSRHVVHLVRRVVH